MTQLATSNIEVLAVSLGYLKFASRKESLYIINALIAGIAFYNRTICITVTVHPSEHALFFINESTIHTIFL